MISSGIFCIGFRPPELPFSHVRMSKDLSLLSSCEDSDVDETLWI